MIAAMIGSPTNLEHETFKPEYTDSQTGKTPIEKADRSAAKDKYGFYFPVHSQIPSTLNVLQSVPVELLVGVCVCVCVCLRSIGPTCASLGPCFLRS